uniref:Uncharacterized protein n=1 Tax=Rhizophora mucronata TaxID=61149 RepID=A0A2P2L4G7_RHIMU
MARSAALFVAPSDWKEAVDASTLICELKQTSPKRRR